jgi:Tfp pilus assembly protein PilF
MHRKSIIGLLLVALTAAVYAQVGDFGFIHIDDPAYVQDNPALRGEFGWREIVWSFETVLVGNWHPLTLLSYQADAALWGRDAAGAFHRTNLALHLLGTWLCFGAVLALTGVRSADGRERHYVWESAFVAAVFALHPMHVESVAWISERKDVLAGAAWWGSLWAWARYVKGSRRKLAYSLSLAAFALGALAKPLVVTLPCVLLLLDRWPLGRGFSLARLVEKWPFFALSAALSLSALWAQQVSGAVVVIERLSVGGRLANAVVAYAGYLQRTVWPLDLALFYPHSQMPGQQPLGAFEVVASLALCVAVSAAAVALARRGRRYGWVGWLWFIGTLVPMIGLVQVGFAASADRYVYLPHAGLALALAFAVGDAVRAHPALRTPVALAGSALIAAWAVASHAQLALWRDSAALFEHTLAVTRNNGFIHYNYGHWLQQQGDLGAAKKQYRAAYAIDPARTGASVNLGALLFIEGEREQGLVLLEESVRRRPEHPLANFNLAQALLQQGHTARARALFARVLVGQPAAKPAHVLRAHAELARLALVAGETAEAAGHYDALLALEPDSSPALAGLARIRAAADDFEGAAALLDRALAGLSEGDPRAIRLRERRQLYREGRVR